MARRIRTTSTAVAFAVAGVATSAGGQAAHRIADSTIAPASSFLRIPDRRRRSLALFGEAGKVIVSPRCMNCHPAGDRPTQGDAMAPHQPLVIRGASGLGAPQMQCATCHQSANNEAAQLPGNPHWRLAPASLAWQGKTLGEICRLLRDRGRNGGMDAHALVEHVTNDTLVSWAWHPDRGRRPAPGTQKEFGAIVRAWIATGAACPR